MIDFSLYEVTSDGCWNWLGAISSEGYAKRGNLYIHREMFKLAHGVITKGLDLDHLCRNRRCINPEHLEAVTRKVNLRRGQNTKLTVEAVRYIRSRRGTRGGRELYEELATKFGCSPKHIKNVARGDWWVDVKGDL